MLYLRMSYPRLDVSLDGEIADAKRCILITAGSIVMETSPTLVLLAERATYTHYKW